MNLIFTHGELSLVLPVKYFEVDGTKAALEYHYWHN